MANPNFKPQTRRSSRNREPVRSLKPLPRILIVCQGEKTEPNYFNGFRVADVEVLHGNGDPSQVIAFAEETFNNNSHRDQVWCVFDRDDFPQFDAAVRRIETLQEQNQPFYAAWSNVCFELWYLLHFEYLQSSIIRERYSEKIADYLQIRYKKNDPAMRDRLQMHEETACRNTERLRKMHDENGTFLPSRRCPMTTVDQLVLVLKQARSL